MAILIPDMFVSFMASPASVNPHLELVREESETWLAKTCGFTSKEKDTIHSLDFSYFCAIVLPSASAHKLRLLCDWGNWIFPFDDAFDNGALKADPLLAQKTVDGLKSIMANGNLEATDALLKAFQDIWSGISEAPTGVKSRFSRYMTEFCDSNLDQVQIQADWSILDIQQLTDLRRGLICATPIFPLVEYANNLDLPDEVIKHPTLEQLRVIVIDIVWIQNDIVSYFKEQHLEEQHNLITVYQHQGDDLQTAFERSGKLLHSRYKDWLATLAEVPFWEERIASQVNLYITGILNVAFANLNWSFRTDRYWYGENEKVRNTREIPVPVQKGATIVT